MHHAPVGSHRLGALSLSVLIGTGQLLSGATTSARPLQEEAQVVPREFFVSPEGRDENPGTSLATSFRTIERAAAAAHQSANDPKVLGDVTVYIGWGVYPLLQPFVMGSQYSGTVNSTIVFQNLPGNVPMITGGTPISPLAWQQEGNLWKAMAGQSTAARQFYVNGVRAIRARSPGGLANAQKNLQIPGYTTTDSSLLSYSNKTDIEVVSENLWKQFRCGVANIFSYGGLTAVQIDGPCWANAQLHAPFPILLPSWIENAMPLLDQPGEWYLNRRTGWIYYYPAPGVPMPYVEAIIPHADQLIVADGLSYVRFQGLVFAHSAWTTPNNNVGFPELQANVAILDTNWGSFMPAGAITLRSAHDVTFERNVFLHLGGAGIEIMDSHDVTISGNHFTDISGNAIEFGDRDVTAPPTLNHDCLIANNYVHDTPVEYQGGVGIFVGQAHNITVRNNEIDDLPYTGISIGWGNGVDVSAFAGNHQVHKNLVQRAMKHMCDGGSFYSNAMQSASSVHDNVFLAQQHGGSALYLDQWSAYYSAYNNVIFDNPGAPMSTTARIKSGQFPNLGQKNDVTANYWQDRGLITPPCFTGPVPDVNATPPEQAHDNTTISALNQAPAYILDAAGLEDAYMDIKILPPMPPFQGEYDTNPPWGMLAGIPSPIYTVLTSVGYPAGTIAGAAFDNVGVTSVSVVIRRGTGYCDGTSSDWDGTAWVAACTVALPATFVPGASTTWTLTSTPPLGQMTPGQTYWVYVNLRDAINNASNWVPNTSTVFN